MVSTDLPHLFAPLQLRGVTLPNRIGVSPMCQYSSEDGFTNDWHLVHLGSRAIGRAGLILVEATAVLPEGRISPKDVGLWKDEHIEMLARIFRFIESQGGVPGMQLAHAGRKASTAEPWKGDDYLDETQGGWRPIYAPSAIPFGEGDPVPQEMTEQDIARVVQAFGESARRLHEAGGKVVEIHAAHGYLLNEFLSPLANKRTDRYGGSFEGRTRMLREVVEAVRRVWPDHLPVFVRISATDWVEGGWTIEDSVALARVLGELGVDLVDCSSGGTVPDASIPVGPGYQVPLARRVRHDGGIATAAVGMITSAQQADQIIRTGDADLVLVAREFLRDPQWPLHAARELRYTLRGPVQYGRAT